MSRRYVSIENQEMQHRSGGGGCCGFLSRLCCCCFSCWGFCLCFLLGIIFISMAIAAALYVFFKPQIPTYSVESLNITTFDIRNDSKLYSEIGLVVKAENPNKGVAMDYGDNNITLMYSGSQLCSGEFIPFLQPGKNTTMINMVMKGAGEFGPEMLQKLLQQNQTGRIPLLIRVQVPLRLVILDMFRLKKVVVGANCSVDIDHFERNKTPNILKREFDYDIRF